MTWTVREYINSRPKQQVDRLLKRIKEGRIEVAGMFLNFSEIVDETALAIQLQALKGFKELGIDVTKPLESLIEEITNEQELEVKKYNRKLNTIVILADLCART